MEFNKAPDMSRFDDFNIITKTYKTVHDHKIGLDMIYSKKLNPIATKKNPAPIILRYHGGGMVGGASLYATWFAPWILQLAERHNAVIVSPNYRFIPESTISEALEDVEDAWNWMHQFSPAVMQEEAGINIDLGRILSTGDSAGGYLSLLAGLRHPDAIRAVHAAYPMDPTDDYYTVESEKEVLGLPSFPKTIISDHLANIAKTKQVVSADQVLARGQLILAFTAHGLLGPYFPKDQRDCYPIYRLEDGARFPRGGVLVWHGRDDTLVPIEQSKRLEKMVSEKDPELNFQLVTQDGEHGFDAVISIDDDWVRDALSTIVQAWLA